MKRLLLSSVFALALVSSSFASEGDLVAKLDNSKTVDRISRYLSADYSQKSDLNYVFELANKKYVSYMKKGLSSEEAASKALNFSLANTKVVLSKEQYHKFLSLINVTMNNTKKISENELLANKQ
ncbi:hypothetical protein [Dysgonomonas massiliensis]|uniref:hypothetical protein n=1 Tax=Dysgonomonas massiliensis TaxID=2040292 RepID=UPI000C7683AA|nr:hypothetical protein [Dysgonomonas massiliensis]